MTILLPLLSMAAVASCQPHGYQYQLPIEYNSYSQHDGNSYSQLKPFRRFLHKYMASSKSKENQPSIQLRYISHPMANVPVSDIHQYMDRQNTDWDQYMVGEYFFKDHDEDHHHFHEEDGDGSDGDEDQLPYTVVEEYEVAVVYPLGSPWLLTILSRRTRRGCTPVLCTCVIQHTWTLLGTHWLGWRG